MVSLCDRNMPKLGRWTEQKGDLRRFNRFLGPVSKIKSGNQYAKDLSPRLQRERFAIKYLTFTMLICKEKFVKFL